MRAVLLLLEDLKQQPGVRVFISNISFAIFKNMATVSTIRRHPRGLKTTLSVHGISHKHIAYLYILFNYCLTENLNSGQLIFKYVFSKIFHYNYGCDQQNYISLEVVTRPFSKKYKMSNKK